LFADEQPKSEAVPVPHLSQAENQTADTVKLQKDADQNKQTISIDIGAIFSLVVILLSIGLYFMQTPYQKRAYYQNGHEAGRAWKEKVDEGSEADKSMYRLLVNQFEKPEGDKFLDQVALPLAHKAAEEKVPFHSDEWKRGFKDGALGK
jgi:hypothetical protein